MTTRPSESALWASVADTLRHTILPDVTDEHARSATIQLIGLAIYAGRRGTDPTQRRLDELRSELGGAAGQDVLRSCAAVLADPHHRAHHVIREILEQHLDEDLETEGVLLEALRGRLPDE